MGDSSAALSTLMLGGFTFQAPLASLLAAGDAVGAGEIGGAQKEKKRKRTIHVECTSVTDDKNRY